MKFFLRKTGIIILAVVLIVAPLSTFLKVEVKAEGAWQEISDSDLNEANDSIKQILSFPEFNAAIFTTNRPGLNLDIFATSDERYQLMSSGLYDDPSNLSIEGIAFGNFAFFALVHRDDGRNHLLALNPSSEGEWVDLTDMVIPSDDSLNIEYISSIDSTFILLVSQTNEDESKDYSWLIYPEEGSPASVEVTEDNFPDIDFGTAEILGFGGGPLGPYVLSLNQGDVGHVFVLTPGEDQDVYELGTTPLPHITSAVVGPGLLVSADNAEDGASVFSLIDDDWEEIVSGGFGDPHNNAAYLVMSSDYNFYAVTSNSIGGDSKVYHMQDLDDWEEVSSFVGVSGAPSGQKYSQITAAGALADGNLIIGASRLSSGDLTHASVWRFVPGEEDDSDPDPGPTDTDNDGTPDSVEDAGPNGGDANNDGFADSGQPNVTTMINPVTGNYVVMQSDGDYNITMGVDPESTDNPDTAFSYPAGLMHFTIQSGGPGQVVSISQYFYGDYDASLITARKYNETDHSYTLIPDAIIENITIGGQNVLEIRYQIEDGSSLDQDGTVDGIITDPSGPALNSVIVPNTGLGGVKSKQEAKILQL